MSKDMQDATDILESEELNDNELEGVAGGAIKSPTSTGKFVGDDLGYFVGDDLGWGVTGTKK